MYSDIFNFFFFFIFLLGAGGLFEGRVGRVFAEKISLGEWVIVDGRSFFFLYRVFCSLRSQNKKKDPARGYAFWSAARDFNEESY